MPSKREPKATEQPVQEQPEDVQQPTQDAPQEQTWTVVASKLNGRQEPSLDAAVGTIRSKGDTITGHQDGDWVAGDDGLHYKAEFLEPSEE